MLSLNTLNAGTVDLDTGTPSIYGYFAGPYNSAGAGNVARFRISSASYRFVPQLSATNNSGVVTMAYSTEPPNNSMGGAAPAVPSASMLQFPYVHIATINGTTEYRQIHVPHDVTDLSLDDFAVTNATLMQSGLDLLYFSAAGVPANVVFGKMYVTVAIDYMPGGSAIGLIKPGPTPNAPGSITLATCLIKEFPHITQLSLSEANDFGQFIASIDSNQFEYVYKEIKAYINKSNYSARPRLALAAGNAGGGNGGDGIASMSFLYE